MFNFRQFEVGPDPFGRKFQVWFKWQQNAISIRHADTVDVKFVLIDENGEHAERTIALPHADLLRVSRDTGRELDDGLCARIAALHLIYLVETGDDIEKDLVTVTPADMKRYAEQVQADERSGARVG